MEMEQWKNGLSFLLHFVLGTVLFNCLSFLLFDANEGGCEHETSSPRLKTHIQTQDSSFVHSFTANNNKLRF